ncbi:collectin-11 [Plakobranchus ocellatus]|uniref:Collectin-11 n=1 Tax=Plakobranchus ocellatus TaxID=259542 RepID=A0AAV4CC36_9GAST|nr:collectin-11 [Plakobranchus ocellatus]
MFVIAILATVLICTFPSRAETVEDVCPEDLINSTLNHLKIFNGTCYQFVKGDDARKQYWEAKDKCKSNSGQLAMPKTEEINQFLVDSLLEFDIEDEVFIGLDDIRREGRFRWVDGSYLKDGNKFFHNFAGGAGVNRQRGPFAPRDNFNDCVVLKPVKNEWYDLDCRRDALRLLFSWEKNRLFICEYTKDDSD